jgi:LysR family nitrogen assimilation transcriptional regulator
MDIRQLKYFVTIAEKGGFTRASELLGIAQPSLGFQIKKLEDEFNIKLLIRTAKGAHPTAAGEALLMRAKRILADVDELKRDISALSEEPHGAVALGLTPSLAHRLLLSIIAECSERYPLIKLNVTEEMSQNLIELLEVGQIGLALTYSVMVTPPKGFAIEHLANEDITLLLHPDQVDDGTRSINFRDIIKFPLILPRKPHRLRVLAERAAAQCGIELNVTYEMQSLPTILRLVQHGLGATLIAGGKANPLVLDGTLRSRELVNPNLRHDVSIIRLEARPMSRAEECVAAIMRRRVREEYGMP